MSTIPTDSQRLTVLTVYRATREAGESPHSAMSASRNSYARLTAKAVLADRPTAAADYAGCYLAADEYIESIIERMSGSTLWAFGNTAAIFGTRRQVGAE